MSHRDFVDAFIRGFALKSETVSAEVKAGLANAVLDAVADFSCVTVAAISEGMTTEERERIDRVWGAAQRNQRENKDTDSDFPRDIGLALPKELRSER